MLYRDHTLAIALLVSLAIHAGFLLVLAGRNGGGRAVSLASSRIPALPKPAYILPDPPPPVAASQLLFGDAEGTGDASNSAPGDKPLSARRSDEIQALLSRDPQGPGRIGQPPAPSALPRGRSKPARPAPAMATASPVGLPDMQGNWSAPTVKHRPIPIQPSKSPAPQGPAPRSPAPKPSPSDPTDNTAPPGSSDPPADPAVQSDSESDPFASKDTRVEFSDGRVDAHLGRKVRTVRPDLSLAAKYDLLSIGFPTMKVRLRIDSGGSVRKVDIIRSSGSESADQAVKVALYQWWIEPKRDRLGRLIDDEVEFSIAWK